MDGNQKQRVSLVMEQKLKQYLEDKAKEEHRSLNNMIIHILTEYMDKRH